MWTIPDPNVRIFFHDDVSFVSLDKFTYLSCECVRLSPCKFCCLPSIIASYVCLHYDIVSVLLSFVLCLQSPCLLYNYFFFLLTIKT